MTDTEEPNKSKKNVEIRFILLGPVGVGKKSIVKRFHSLRCTSTNEKSIEEFHVDITKKKSEKKEQKNPQTLYNSTNEIIEEEDEETKKQLSLQKRREQYRINLLKIYKIYKVGLTFLELSFFPCTEPTILPYDYELKEDDEDYEFEKEYKITLNPLIKELANILMMPPRIEKSSLEYLILLCFDLSNFDSFEKLVVYFMQINKHLKILTDYKMVLIGNKMDKKCLMNDEQKSSFNKFIEKLNLNYYEISTYMFFSFENFFENLLHDNFENLPIFKDEALFKTFNDMLHQKKSFSQTKRPIFGFNTNPGPSDYQNDPYELPHTRKGMVKMFQNKNKYNKHTFINKSGALFPPLKKEKEKDNNNLNTEFFSNNYDNINNKNKKSKSKKDGLYAWDIIQNKDLKNKLQLTSDMPGYSLGMKTYKPIGIKNERKKKIEKINIEISKAFESGIGIKNMSQNWKASKSQEKFAENRLQKNKNYLEECKKKNLDIQKRHEEVMQNNNSKIEEKLKAVKEKEDKYTKIFEEMEKEKFEKQYQIKNNINPEELFHKTFEIKAKFYDPVSSISTNKGFTFGQKLFPKEKPKDGADFSTLKTDFDKLLTFNKKYFSNRKVDRNVERFPKFKEIGFDSSEVVKKQKEKQKMFETNRTDFRKKTYEDFFKDREDKKKIVKKNKKKNEKEEKENLRNQIIKTYASDFKKNDNSMTYNSNIFNDNNYLIRDINYTQVETSFPKYSIKGKYETGSIFDRDKQYSADKNNFNRNNFLNMLTEEKQINNLTELENPEIAVIRPKYPAFSFGHSNRFNISINEARNTVSGSFNNSINKDNKDLYMLYSDGIFCAPDSKSFLKTQTSMGTGKKLFKKENGFPGPGQYKLKGFTDDVIKNGNKINLNRVSLNKKAKEEEVDKQRREKLREQWLEDKKITIKMGVREGIEFMKNKSQDNSNENKGNYNEEVNENFDDREDMQLNYQASGKK